MSDNEHHIRYFDNLNYSLANEDSAVELEAMPDDARHVLAVAGSGARVLPLLAKGPELVTCVDLSPQQLWLTELRVASIRALDLETYLAFWGYPPRTAQPNERQRIFESLKLSDEARTFFSAGFAQRGWTSLLYTGRWERTFAKMQKLNTALTGTAGRGLFDARTLDEQRDYLSKRFPRRRWLTALGITGNPIAFNLLLYRGHFPKKNIPKSPFAFYRDTFDHLFTTSLARENYFLQIVFFGKLQFPEANPIECHPDVFKRIQQNLQSTEIVYEQGELLSVLGRYNHELDFVSLSDVPSYLEPPAEQTFLKTTRAAMREGGRAVARYYLRVPERSDRTGWTDVTPQFRQVITDEKVGVYRIEVLDAS